MQIDPDDNVYCVDAVWLGPPKATFPCRVRYVAWGIGLALFLLILTVERMVGIGMGLFSTAWGLLIAIALTRWATRLISYERPLGATLALMFAELRTPRERTKGEGGRWGTKRAIAVRPFERRDL